MTYQRHEYFEVLSPRHDLELPLIVVLPNAGDQLPGGLKHIFALEGDELAQLARNHAELDAVRLFSPAAAQGATVVINHISNLVVDQSLYVPPPPPPDIDLLLAVSLDGLPREELGLEEPSSAAVPTTTPDGSRTLHGPEFSEEDRLRLMDEYYYPFQYAVETLVQRFLARYGRCWIVEGRTHRPDPAHESDAQRITPYVRLGSDERHKAGELERWFLDRQKTFDGSRVDVEARGEATRRPLVRIESDQDACFCPLGWRGKDDRVRMLRVSMLREYPRKSDVREMADPAEPEHLMRGFLKFAAKRTAERLDLHRSCIPAHEAGNLVDQYLKNRLRGGNWTIRGVLDGDQSDLWYCKRRTSFFGFMEYRDFLDGCWVVEVEPWVSDPETKTWIQPKYIVDKWSGEVWVGTGVRRRKPGGGPQPYWV